MEKPSRSKRIDYFSDREEVTQRKFAQFRTRMLGPMVSPLQHLGVTANQITLAGVCFLIPYAYFFEEAPRIASLLIWLYVLCDGLDGVYARATNTATPAGALADVFADQMGMVVTCLLLIHASLVTPVLGAYYCAIYLVMIALSVVQNHLEIPMQTILRSKYPLYGLVGVWAYAGINVFDWMMGFFAITMTVNAAQSFRRISGFLGQ
ncbi:MAG: CDP-alcohol phosphatidyltransferase family protein [Verrucomicrobiota bacterium]